MPTKLTTKELFETVFHPDGSITLCGRAVCRTLIERLNKETQTTDYGCVISGNMNVENVVRYGREHGYLETPATV